MKTATLIIMGIIAALLLANGLFMLVSPEAWYWSIPGVPDRGPFNQHFIRDIGIAYSLIAIGFAAGINFIQQRVALWAAGTAWLAGHALFHFWEVAVGLCGPESLLQDIAGVTLPAIIGCVAIYIHRGSSKAV